MLLMKKISYKGMVGAKINITEELCIKCTWRKRTLQKYTQKEWNG